METVYYAASNLTTITLSMEAQRKGHRRLKAVDGLAGLACCAALGTCYCVYSNY